MKSVYSVATNRDVQPAWAQVVSKVYQPQKTILPNPARYRGRIVEWTLHDLALSYYESGPAHYRRTPKHIVPEAGDYYYVCIPRAPGSVLTLVQGKRNGVCLPGQLMMVSSARTCEQSHNEMSITAVRLPGRTIRERIRRADEHCAVVIPCNAAVGALFVALADATVDNAESLGGMAEVAVAEKLADLFAVTLETHGEAVLQEGTAAQAAHRARVMRYIAAHYREPDLSPAAIATACHISLRYLHRLFASGEFSVGEWIMEKRLLEARRLLEESGGAFRTIAEIAYHCGFEDASHFSRRFRARFSVAPKDVRERKLGAAPDELGAPGQPRR